MSIDAAVVKRVYKYKKSKASNFVVIRSNSFQLCSCLQALRRGLPCRHTVAAIVTELKMYPKNQRKVYPPLVVIFAKAMVDRGAGLTDFDGHERGPYSEGLTGDLEGIDCGEEEVAKNNNSKA